MRLVELRLKRSPGIRDPFALQPSAGVNLVTGPNGIGKSSVCRALQALLWPETVRLDPFHAEAEFDLEGRRITVSRQDKDSPVWNGTRPDTGPDHLGGRYRLGVLDLLDPNPKADPLALEIRRHMAGGFDLEAVRREMFTAETGISAKSAWTKADALVHQLDQEQKRLAAEQDHLNRLRQTRDLAGQARDRMAVLEMVRDLAAQSLTHEEAVARLQDMPAAAESVRAEDPDKITRLRLLEGELDQRIESRSASLDAQRREWDRLTEAGLRSDDLSLDLLRKKQEDLSRLAADLRLAERDAQDERLAEILAEEPPRTAMWPYVVAFVIGAGLFAAGLFADLPGNLWKQIFAGVGIALATVGIWGGLARPRDPGQTALIQEKKRELARKQDLLESCGRQWSVALADFNAALQPADLPAVTDATAALQAVEEIESSRARRRELQGLRDDEEFQLERDRKDLAERRAEISTLLARLALPDSRDSDAEVARLLELKPAFDETLQERNEAAQAMERLRRKIAAGRSWLRDQEGPDLPAAALDELIAHENELAGHLRSLDEEIARIDAVIKHTSEGHGLQQATAVRETACSALADVRQNRREAALGHLLLDHVARSHERESRPRVLEEARALFGLFTGHRYELKMAAQSQGEDRFVAVPDDSVQELELDQLSDGTRAQLLLAVKLAFITVEESGARPPVFLDDSLTSADPERFALVAASLGRLADRQGRQVFYLTPNPADAAAFGRALADAGLPAAHHIDLARIRGLAGAADPADLNPANLPANILAPDPAGMTAAAYAEALLAPRPDPWEPAGALHVLHLLSEDLDLVRRLVDGGAANLKRFATVRDTLITAGEISETEAALIEARGDVWDAWLDCWRIGRARPVTRRFLKNSAAVSKTYLDQVVAVLDNRAGDGAALLEALEAKDVKGFRAQKIDQLRAELEEAELLDPRPLRTEDELLAHVLNRVAPLMAADLLDMPKVRTLALTFAKIIEN